jgi:aspartate oxidase
MVSLHKTGGLKLCLRVLNEIEDTLQDKRCLNKEFMECFNMLTIAKLITRQALKREESIGTHYLLKEGI